MTTKKKILISIFILVIGLTGCEDENKIAGMYSDKTETESYTENRNDIITIEVYRDYEADVVIISDVNQIREIVDAYTEKMDDNRIIPNNERDGLGLSLTLKHKNGDCDEVIVWEESFQVGDVTYGVDVDFLSTMMKLCFN